MGKEKNSSAASPCYYCIAGLYNCFIIFQDKVSKYCVSFAAIPHYVKSKNFDQRKYICILYIFQTLGFMFYGDLQYT